MIGQTEFTKAKASSQLQGAVSGADGGTGDELHDIGTFARTSMDEISMDKISTDIHDLVHISNPLISRLKNCEGFDFREREF